MKRILALLLAFCMALCLAACGKTEPEPAAAEAPQAAEPETPDDGYIEELPAKNELDPASPIPADTGALALHEEAFDEYNLNLLLPDGVTASIEERGSRIGTSSVLVTSGDGVWQIEFMPYVLAGFLENNIEQTLIYDGQDIKTDRSGPIETTIEGFPAKVWANNMHPGWLNPTNEMEVPSVDIVIDYGDTYVGKWYGMAVRLKAQEPAEDTNIYELLYLRAVRAVLNNFEIVTTDSTVTYSSGGISAEFPARWDVVTTDMGLQAYLRNSDMYGMFSLKSASGGDPAAKAAVWGAESFEVSFGGRDYIGVITTMDSADEEPDYLMWLYAAGANDRCLTVSASFRDYTAEDYMALLENDTVKAILDSVEIDPSTFTDPDTKSENGFTAYRGALTDYSGGETDIEIPAEIGGNTIVYIQDAFTGNTKIKSVVIPEGVTQIQNAAFSGCTSLETVVLPSSLQKIGPGAFENCPNLTDVVIPEMCTEVMSSAFEGSGRGTFTGSVATYGNWCFKGSTFDTITIPDGSDVSAQSIFEEATATTVTLPSDCAELGQSAFDYAHIENLELPSSLRILGDYCFMGFNYDADSFEPKKTFEIPEGVEEIGNGCFANMDLAYFVVPASVKRILGSSTINADLVFLRNPDVEIDPNAIIADYLYLYNVYAPEQAPATLANCWISDQVFLPADATIDETLVFDDYLLSIGWQDITWIGFPFEWMDTDFDAYEQDSHWLTAYTGGGDTVGIPYYGECWNTFNLNNIRWLPDEVFAGNTDITTVYLGYVVEMHSRIFDGCTALKDVWFRSSWIDSIEKDLALASDTFAGMPDGVTFHLPASWTAEERQTFEQALVDAGMPSTTEIDYYSLREGAAADGRGPDELDAPADDGEITGTWTGLYTKFVGDPDSARDESDTFTLELNADGTGVHHRNGGDFNVSWTLDGADFRMEERFIGDPIIYVGTFTGSGLDIFNGDPDDIWSCEYVYQK